MERGNFYNGEIEQRSLLETHGDVEVTYEGLTLPLRQMVALCPKDEEKMDPDKLEKVAQAFLDGKSRDEIMETIKE